jgi:predicted CoA-binding protein
LSETDNIMTDPDEIAAFLATVRTVAVLGIKPETHGGQPAHYVAASLARAGLKIIPVPVYYPEVTEILGQKVFRRVSDIGEAIDIVDVFRRPSDIEQHVEDILAAKPRMVWLQSGIRHDSAARRFSAAGIKVVQDQCLMVEYAQIRSFR